ncbi:MAG: Spo0E family sporulation regulatory protein-aspartic acid phosphatase [Moorellaceae bacterium]
MNKEAGSLAQEIERLRRQLESLIDQGRGVDSEEVRRLSRKLDEMVVEYTRRQKGQSK